MSDYDERMADLPAEKVAVGTSCVWYYVPRGGYGQGFYVDALIVGVTARRVRIEVINRRGEGKRVNVHRESLRDPNAERIRVPRFRCFPTLDRG